MKSCKGTSISFHGSYEWLLIRIRHYATSTHKPLPPLTTLLGHDVKKNGPHVAVSEYFWKRFRPHNDDRYLVTCLDSRCNPYEVLGFKPYEIICSRNLGGRITPALTDLAAMDTFFHLNQIIILHHNNCGTTHITSDQELQDIKSKCTDVSDQELKLVVQLSPARVDTEDALNEDLQRLRECKFLRKDLTESAMGLYLDVKTGLVKAI